jgi:hypothetical protein
MPRAEGRAMVPSALDLLRPKPFRGDVVAAGVVVLTTLVGVVAVRFDEAWAAGAHLAYALVAWAFVTALAVLSPMERDDPRAYQSVLYVSSVALFAVVVVRLGEVLGSDGALSSAATTTWAMTALAVYAFAFAFGRNSAACTLIGSITGGIAVIAAVQWIWDPSDARTFRWVLLALMLVYAVAAIGQRDRRLRHGVALIDAAGLAVLAIGLTFVSSLIAFNDEEPITGVAWGWELLIMAAGFGLVAYSSVDRQPGPAYLGVLNLVTFTVITSLGVSAGGATLVGWPVALALAAGALLVIGLRPTTPAPPPPDADAPEAPPLPLR